jgi:hypothetical protein
MNHANAGHHFEKLARHMGSGADASRRHIDSARIILGIGNKFLNRLRLKRRIDSHDQGLRAIPATGAMSRTKS